jgi:hypothetical protein
MKEGRPREFLNYVRREITPAQLTEFVISYLQAVHGRGAEVSDEEMDKAFAAVEEILYLAWRKLKELKNEPVVVK